MFDIGLAIFGLIVFFPVMIICAVLTRLGSKGPVLFRQKRVGKDFELFEILKFRSMVVDAPSLGAQVTVDRDPRITGAGRIMRKTKLDELPQLFNVLKGEMSFVGPRPEVPEYVEMFRDDYTQLLTVRPGITGLSAIKFRNEEDILAAAADPKQAYIQEVLPEKIALAKEYIGRTSLLYDVKLILLTLLRIVGWFGKTTG